MFPIRDHNPSEQTPYVTYTLMAINLAVFAVYWHLFDDELRLNRFFYTWGLTPDRLAAQDQIYTLFTSMFLHGGLMHLGGNLLFLWIFGDNLEDEFGHAGYLLFYLFSGVCAGLAHVAFDPSSSVPMVGASGAIAGVMGAYFLLFPKAKVDILFIFIVFFKIFPIPAWIMLGIWFGIQLMGGIDVNAAASGVAYWAHIGGFICGVIYAVPFWLKRGGVGFWRSTKGHPPHPEHKYKRGKTSVPFIPRRR